MGGYSPPRQPLPQVKLSSLQQQCWEYLCEGMTEVEAYRKAKGLEGDVTDNQRVCAYRVFNSVAMTKKKAEAATQAGIRNNVNTDTIITIAMRSLKLAMEERDEKGRLYALASVAPLLKVLGKAAGCETPPIDMNGDGFTIVIESNHVRQSTDDMASIELQKQAEVESIDIKDTPDSLGNIENGMENQDGN